MRLERAADCTAAAWASQRVRLRAWLDALPELEWSGPTRCSLWDTSALVRHLVSGSQFLGYTLHKANRGVPTALMQGFDTHQTVRADAERFGDLAPGRARELLESKDASVAAELVAAAAGGWSATAEAPPGQLPADLAVNHFLLDSWVHEYDLMLPRGEQPVVDSLEAEAVVTYLIGLASLQTRSTAALDLRLSSPDLRVGLQVANETVHVTVGSAPNGAVVIEGAAAAVVDRATGRRGGSVRGDVSGLAVLDGFGELLAR